MSKLTHLERATIEALGRLNAAKACLGQVLSVSEYLAVDVRRARAALDTAIGVHGRAVDRIMKGD